MLSKYWKVMINETEFKKRNHMSNYHWKLLLENKVVSLNVSFFHLKI